MSEIATNLKLALAFFDMGEVEDAKGILRQAVASGSDKARILLEKIEAGARPTLVSHDAAPEQEAAQLLAQLPSPAKEQGRCYHIDETHSGGLILENEDGSVPTLEQRLNFAPLVSYSITDENGQALADKDFEAYEQARDFAKVAFPDRRPWMPPAPSIAELAGVIAQLRSFEEDRALDDATQTLRPADRVRMHWALRQRTLPPTIAERIKSLL